MCLGVEWKRKQIFSNRTGLFSYNGSSWSLSTLFTGYRIQSYDYSALHWILTKSKQEEQTRRLSINVDPQMSEQILTFPRKPGKQDVNADALNFIRAVQIDAVSFLEYIAQEQCKDPELSVVYQKISRMGGNLFRFKEKRISVDPISNIFNVGQKIVKPPSLKRTYQKACMAS